MLALVDVLHQVGVSFDLDSKMGYHQQRNNFAGPKDTCRDKVTKKFVSLQHTSKKVSEKKTKAGIIFDPGWWFGG